VVGLHAESRRAELPRSRRRRQDRDPLVDRRWRADGSGGVQRVPQPRPERKLVTGQGDVLTQDRLLAFARCMRSHGVPAFPDPQVVNGHVRLGATHGQIDPSSPIVTAAMAACRSTLGATSARGEEKLVQGAANRPAGGKGK
jgi:hypothetical protein